MPRTWRAKDGRIRQLLRRVVGPEPHMEYRPDAEGWFEDLRGLAGSLGDPLSIPPLIAEYHEGVPDLRLADGNTRYGAMHVLGWTKCWVITWYDSDHDRLRHGMELGVGAAVRFAATVTLADSLGLSDRAIRTLTFAAELSSARDAEEVKHAISQLAQAATSRGVKRAQRHDWLLAVQAYGGVQGGRESAGGQVAMFGASTFPSDSRSPLPTFRSVCSSRCSTSGGWRAPASAERTVSPTDRCWASTRSWPPAPTSLPRFAIRHCRWAWASVRCPRYVGRYLGAGRVAFRAVPGGRRGGLGARQVEGAHHRDYRDGGQVQVPPESARSTGG